MEDKNMGDLGNERYHTDDSGGHPLTHLASL
jgi:hypothetical protein